MEFATAFQSLLSQSPALALAFLIWYFSNRDMLRLLQERREMIEALHIELKDLSVTSAQLVTDYKTELRSASESKIAVQSELHALKGKVQELILKVEMLLMRSGDDKPKEGHD